VPAVLIATGLLAVAALLVGLGAWRLERAVGAVLVCRPDRWRAPARDLSAATETLGRVLAERVDR
jgi:hypothetical protein